MKDVCVSELFRNMNEYAEQEITVRGWIRANKGSGKFGLIELNDGTFFEPLQIVYENESLENFSEISKAPIGAAIKATGRFTIMPEAEKPFELQAAEVEIEADSADDYPLQKKCSIESLREIAHIRPRSSTFSAVFRVRSLVAYAVHKFFQENDFVYVNTPIITGSNVNDTCETFRVTTLEPDDISRDKDGNADYSGDFFGKEASLTVSGQLEAEAFAMAFRKVYAFGPTFRAENSYTPRHASEFWMIEPEVAFANLADNMDLAENMIKYIIKYVIQKAHEEMEFFSKTVDKGLIDRLAAIANAEFARITYTEAVDMLQKSSKKFECPVEWGIDLQTEHERYLTEEILQKPVFVTDYPKDIRAFYMRLNDDGRTVAACDLLMPGVGEILSGSQREERLEVLEARMNEQGIKKEDYQWYMDLRKYGGVEHSGYGLGFERIIMYITGMGNIRDVLPFPRTPKKAEF